jgi:putative ABC transport system permease protein
MNFLQLKNSYRVLLSKKGYLLINILGLGIGFASFLILALYIYNDLTYNHFNKNLADIYRIREGELVQTKGLLLPKMLEQVPEIQNGTRVFGWDGFRISYKETAFPQNIQYADTGFFSIFSFPFTEGSATPGIHEKYGVILSTELAKKLFGNEPAIGKSIQVKFEDLFLKVNGVVKIPDNSSVKFDIIASYETGTEISPWVKEVNDWYNTFSETYVLLKKGIDPESISSKLQDIVHEYFIPVGQNNTRLNLLPFKEYHSLLESNKTLIMILAIIALGILGIAMINFVNLTITSSFSRTKEIGIKKVAGAGSKKLFSQMMIEALLVSFISLLIGVELVSIFLPSFNHLFNINLQIENVNFIFLVALLVSVWLTVGILSGIIPSSYWSGISLMQILQGRLFRPGKHYLSRYSLVIFQFVVAIVLISGTILIRKQINFMLQKDPKFDKENVIVANLDSWQYPDSKKASQKFRLIAEQLKASPYVESVCFSQNIPGLYSENYNNFYPEDSGSVASISLKQAYTGRDYFKTYGIKVLSGNGFDEDLVSYNNTMVLNQTAMRKLGFKEAKKQILHQSTVNGTGIRIVGMVEDFSYQGVQNEMQPLAHFFNDYDDYSNWNFLSVRAKAGSSMKVIELLKNVWKNTEPSSSVDYYFAVDKLNDYYKEFIKINKIIAWFSILAVILSCVGLFTLSSYALTRKTKEIGIRKVNGARIFEILLMVNKDFAKGILVAFVIACPVALYALHKWLESFAYKTAVNWWLFFMAGVITAGITLLTVLWQSWKAASKNPVEALRYE